MLRVGVLASGGGTNLQALLDSVHGHEAEIVAVASDRPDAYALVRAQQCGVLTRVFPRHAYEKREDRDAAIADWLDDQSVDLVVLAGYMALLRPVFVQRFADRIINVHPSLLPAFKGWKSVQEAVDYGVRVFGVTVHFVDEKLDHGPILLQRAIDLPQDLDANAALALLRPIEHALLPEAVRLIAAGRVRRDPAHPRRVLIDPA